MVKQLTLDIEHYLGETVRTSAEWGHRYLAFTDYDVQIVEVRGLRPDSPVKIIVYTMMHLCSLMNELLNIIIPHTCSKTQFMKISEQMQFRDHCAIVKMRLICPSEVTLEQTSDIHIVEYF